MRNERRPNGCPHPADCLPHARDKGILPAPRLDRRRLCLYVNGCLIGRRDGYKVEQARVSLRSEERARDPGQIQAAHLGLEVPHKSAPAACASFQFGNWKLEAGLPVR